MICRVCGRETGGESSGDVGTCVCVTGQAEPPTFNSFLSRALSDSVNGGSGDWSAYASGIRAELEEGRGPWDGKPHGRPCRSCDRYSMDCEDGQCGQCRGEAKPDLAGQLQAAARQGHRNAAGALRRLAQRETLPHLARLYSERAEWHEREASRG